MEYQNTKKNSSKIFSCAQDKTKDECNLEIKT